MNTDEVTHAGAEAPLYCANHPGVETYLRCSRCGKPVCARCRVSTPVGFRCFECANLQVLPTYAISSDYYLKASLAGFAAAAGAGALMGLLPAFEFWAALLMGIIVPEAVTAAANQKRGPGLQMVGMAAVVFGFVLSRLVLQAFPLLIPLGGVNMPGESSIIPGLGGSPYFVTQYTVLWLALALFLANRRLR